MASDIVVALLYSRVPGSILRAAVRELDAIYRSNSLSISDADFLLLPTPSFLFFYCRGRVCSVGSVTCTGPPSGSCAPGCWVLFPAAASSDCRYLGAAMYP
jgi:hypothetical protein